jgi:hypothetical protein
VAQTMQMQIICVKGLAGAKYQLQADSELQFSCKKKFSDSSGRWRRPSAPRVGSFRSLSALICAERCRSRQSSSLGMLIGRTSAASKAVAG